MSHLSLILLITYLLFHIDYPLYISWSVFLVPGWFVASPSLRLVAFVFSLPVLTWTLAYPLYTLPACLPAFCFASLDLNKSSFCLPCRLLACLCILVHINPKL
ncbi:hypothetical protein XENORESO_007892 [Xenotaenia resolanae]|uniref:NADH dehydrogenase subunit 1 n=1 Tax=Xenotaenia resolanae TaxID=208358 RepID=A0ABV0WDM6_9TELE